MSVYTERLGFDWNIVSNISSTASMIWNDLGKVGALDYIKGKILGSKAAPKGTADADALSSLETMLKAFEKSDDPDEAESEFEKSMRQAAPWLIGGGIAVVGLIALMMLAPRRR